MQNFRFKRLYFLGCLLILLLLATVEFGAGDTSQRQSESTFDNQRHGTVSVSAPYMTPEISGHAAAPALNIALYPYVPRLDQFKQVISKAWAQQSPSVPLNYVDWDCYSQDPPNNLDVFVFDGIFLDYYVSKGFLSALQPDEIEDPGDFLPYALNDSKINNFNYAIPQIGCANILFYRQDDKELAQANTLSEINRVIGQCSDDSLKPPYNKTLIVDLSGGTTDACLYLETVQDINGRYDPNPPLPSPTNLNGKAISNLHRLVDMGCVAPTACSTGTPYQGAIWFGSGKGRATIGFTESLSAMGDARQTVDFKLMPFADGNDVHLFYVDLVGVNASVTDPARRELALKLANLISSSRVVSASFGPTPTANYPQYLMPVRKSVFESLETNDRLYRQMYGLVKNNHPRMFRIGPASTSWLKTIKGSVRQRILSGLTTGVGNVAGRKRSSRAKRMYNSENYQKMVSVKVRHEVEEFLSTDY